MNENQILSELGIDNTLSADEIKQALEKKKQGLLRKINAVFGNTAKEQELNIQLNQIEDLIIQFGVKQIVKMGETHNGSSSLLSNVKNEQLVRMDQFEVTTKNLSQSSVDTVSVSEDQKIINKAVKLMDENNYDAAYELLISCDPEKSPMVYAALGWLYGNKSSYYYSEEKSFACYLKGAELDIEFCYEMVARAYHRGYCTKADKDKAIYWYKKASEVCDTDEPERGLGEIYGERGQFKEMFGWYQLGIYEHNSWKSRLEFAQALLNYDLGSYYTGKALEMLRSKQFQVNVDARRGAYSALLKYYTKMESINSIYRSQIVEITAAMADEELVPCAAIVASMYAQGYAGSIDMAAATKYYEIAIKNGEQFDKNEYESAKRAFSREEKKKRFNDHPFTATDAAKLVSETRKSRSDVLIIPEGYTLIKGNAFEEFKGKGILKKSFFSEVVLPDSLLSIEADAFTNLKGLMKFNLPPNIINLGYGAFYKIKNNIGVNLLEIPGGIEVIPRSCFWSGRFDTVHIQEGVEEIRSMAFAFCHIGRLVLPSSLRYIDCSDDNGSFYYCTIERELYAPIALKPLLENQKNFNISNAKVTYL